MPRAGWWPAWAAATLGAPPWSIRCLKKEKESGPKRKLIAFELNERGIPRQGYDIVDAEGNKIGTVTSGTMSPSLSKGIGLGYVNKPHTKRDTKIFIQVRKKAIPAQVVRLPFYKG